MVSLHLAVAVAAIGIALLPLAYAASGLPEDFEEILNYNPDFKQIGEALRALESPPPSFHNVPHQVHGYQQSSPQPYPPPDPQAHQHLPQNVPAPNLGYGAAGQQYAPWTQHQLDQYHTPQNLGYDANAAALHHSTQPYTYDAGGSQSHPWQPEADHHLAGSGAAAPPGSEHYGAPQGYGHHEVHPQVDLQQAPHQDTRIPALGPHPGGQNLNLASSEGRPSHSGPGSSADYVDRQQHPQGVDVGSYEFGRGAGQRMVSLREQLIVKTNYYADVIMYMENFIKGQGYSSVFLKSMAADQPLIFDKSVKGASKLVTATGEQTQAILDIVKTRFRFDLERDFITANDQSLKHITITMSKILPRAADALAPAEEQAYMWTNVPGRWGSVVFYVGEYKIKLFKTQKNRHATVAIGRPIDKATKDPSIYFGTLKIPEVLADRSTGAINRAIRESS